MCVRLIYRRKLTLFFVAQRDLSQWVPFYREIVVSFSIKECLRVRVFHRVRGLTQWRCSGVAGNEVPVLRCLRSISHSLNLGEIYSRTTILILILLIWLLWISSVEVYLKLFEFIILLYCSCFSICIHAFQANCWLVFLLVNPFT